MEIANGISFELLSLRLVAFHIWQSGDPMSLQTAMQCRARQMWDRWLQGIEAVIKRQQSMTPESHDHCFLICAQNCETGFRRTSFAILSSHAFAPFGDRFDIDTKVPAQRRVRSLRLLNFCSDCVRGRGAAMTYLSYSASFHSKEQIAPSSRGIKHLVQQRSVYGMVARLYP